MIEKNVLLFFFFSLCFETNITNLHKLAARAECREREGVLFFVWKEIGSGREKEKSEPLFFLMRSVDRRVERLMALSLFLFLSLSFVFVRTCDSPIVRDACVCVLPTLRR